MDFNIEVRRKQLENLNQLISTTKNRLNSALEFLEWSPEKVKKENLYINCPINVHHRILPESWKGHIEKCIVTSGGYKLNEQFLTEPYELNDPRQSIYLDRNKKIEVITKEIALKGSLNLAWNGLDADPQTSDRLFSTFSSDERLTFYNYAVENTVAPPPPPEFITNYIKSSNDKDKPLTTEEVLAQERDAKRRRVKYKSVHINKKNYTEVVREVINGQMEEYKEWLETKKNGLIVPLTPNAENVDEERKDEPPERRNASIGRHSNHSGSSRSTNRRNNDRRRSSRDRTHYDRKRSRSKDRNDRSSRNRSSDHRSRRRSRDRDRNRDYDRRRPSSRDRRSGSRRHESNKRH